MTMEIASPMQCDPETGVCEVPQPATEALNAAAPKPVKLLYFTDPICSSCWGIEPQFRKLKQEYGHYFGVEYRMGGLLKSWGEYGGNDVNGPQSVARHWEEASGLYGMPINGDVWLNDPLHSSYPPSIGFKAAQLQDAQKAERFLRRIKEMVFIEKKNITKTEHLLQAAADADLDVVRFQLDYGFDARDAFEEDLAVAKAWGVRGFPTVYFIDGDDNRFKVYGSKPYRVYEQALLKLLPGDAVKETPFSYEAIFNGHDTVTLKEFALFYDKDLEEAGAILQRLEEQHRVRPAAPEAGTLWRATACTQQPA